MEEIRLIDANALKENLRQYFTDGVLDGVSARLAFNQILHDIDNAPTVNFISEKIIRCQDCKYYHPFKHWCDVHEDWAGGKDGYCSLAKRRGDEE